MYVLALYKRLVTTHLLSRRCVDVIAKVREVGLVRRIRAPCAAEVVRLNLRSCHRNLGIHRVARIANTRLIKWRNRFANLLTAPFVGHINGLVGFVNYDKVVDVHGLFGA